MLPVKMKSRVMKNARKNATTWYESLEGLLVFLRRRRYVAWIELKILAHLYLESVLGLFSASSRVLVLSREIEKALVDSSAGAGCSTTTADSLLGSFSSSGAMASCRS